MTIGFQLTTPVVLTIFNRPDVTRRVFEIVRGAEPPQLFVIADGPRGDHRSDVERCAATRAVIQRVDWDCEVLTDYAECNMGLSDRVSSGLDWVFGQCERAMVLEDDCLPDPSFFRFCDELLERYRHDERMMAISGDNFQFGRRRTRHSYYFSRYNHCWGWATWRRAWRYYDHEMRLWPLIRDGGWLGDILDGDRAAIRYWSRVFEGVYKGRINSWAYRWTLACWLQGGLTVLPNANLVTNIGYGHRATHTGSRRSRYAHMESAEMLFPLVHPSFVIRDVRADAYTQRTHYEGTSLWVRARSRIGTLLKSRAGRPT
jgi:hypothetical protein